LKSAAAQELHQATCSGISCESQKKLQIAERKINDLQRLLTREDANFYKSKCQWLRNYKSRCKWFHPDFTGAALWAKKGIWEPQESESEK
jgi:hypothetical protein